MRICLLAALVLVLAGCGANAFNAKDSKADLLTIAVWNVQSLFDGEEDGTEYREYRSSADWTAEKYQGRITALSRAIVQMFQPDTSISASALRSGETTPAPAVLGLVELERASALEDLAQGELSKYGYLWAAFANASGAPLGLGVLSRFPLLDVRAHSITIENATIPRPILEVRIEVRGQELVFLVCHWKSKVGGAEATTPLRRAASRVVQRRLGELQASEPEIPVIVMGDLNENHDEFYRSQGELFPALLIDDPDAARRAQGRVQDFLVLSGEKPPRALSFNESYGDSILPLYSPWFEDVHVGSYYYKDNWETIDHFLLSPDFFSDGSDAPDKVGNSRWQYEGFSVLNYHPFVRTTTNIPNSYVPRTGKGLSDHLPLLLYLRRKGD